VSRRRSGDVHPAELSCCCEQASLRGHPYYVPERPSCSITSTVAYSFQYLIRRTFSTLPDGPKVAC